MFETYILKAVFVLGILAISFLSQVLVNTILNVYCNKIITKTKTRFDNQIFPLIKRLLGILIWGIGIVVILFKFGIIDLLSLATTVGISSIVISMLIKESIANIVGGVTIMLDRPFRVGDKIKLASGDLGEVIKIGLRRTRILIPRTKDEGKSVLVIPNKDLTKAKVYNYTFAKERDNEQKEKENQPTGDTEKN